MSKPLRCWMGRHVWVRVHAPHAPHGQPRGPDRYVCTACQKSCTASIPLGVLGG